MLLQTRLELRVPLCCERCEERVKESLLDMDGKLLIIMLEFKGTIPLRGTLFIGSVGFRVETLWCTHQKQVKVWYRYILGSWMSSPKQKHFRHNWRIHLGFTMLTTILFFQFSMLKIYLPHDVIETEEPLCDEPLVYWLCLQGRDVVMHPEIGQSLIFLHSKVMWSPR
jgi:hypothetical protein